MVRYRARRADPCRSGGATPALASALLYLRRGRADTGAATDAGAQFDRLDCAADGLELASLESLRRHRAGAFHRLARSQVIRQCPQDIGSHVAPENDHETAQESITGCFDFGGGVHARCCGASLRLSSRISRQETQKRKPRHSGRGRCAASSGRSVRFAPSAQADTDEAEA